MRLLAGTCTCARAIILTCINLCVRVGVCVHICVRVCVCVCVFCAGGSRRRECRGDCSRMTVSPTASRRAGSELRCVAPRRTSLPPFSQAAIVGFLELHLHPGLGLHSHLVGARALLRLGQADLDLPTRPTTYVGKTMSDRFASLCIF